MSTICFVIIPSLLKAVIHMAFLFINVLIHLLVHDLHLSQNLSFFFFLFLLDKIMSSTLEKEIYSAYLFWSSAHKMSLNKKRCLAFFFPSRTSSKQFICNILNIVKFLVMVKERVKWKNGRLLAYPSARNNDHGGCDDVILI